MKIAIPTEIKTGEKRIAATPSTVTLLKKLGYTVLVEAGAGKTAFFSDESYWTSGAEIIDDTAKLWQFADIILKVQPPTDSEIKYLHDDQTLISFFWPALNNDLLQKLAEKNITVLAMDCVPRLSRAQKMDALSSTANISGYRAIIEAAHYFDRFFSGQITAAGKTPPAKVLVIGAGVAGLASVRAFDTRLEVKEQVESMGAEFLVLDFEESGSGVGGYSKVMSDEFIAAEMALFSEQVKDVDIVITTALIPGKPAPTLITEEMVNTMRGGSIIVDLAAEQGGNCALTRPSELVTTDDHVTIIGFTDLASRLPQQASQLYASNLRHLLDEMTPDGKGQFSVDFENEIIHGTTIIKKGEITWPPPPSTTETPKVSLEKSEGVPANPIAKESAEPRSNNSIISLLLGAGIFLAVGVTAPASFIPHFTLFVLACFIGYLVIWNVSPSLHTPLMSVTNAISSIIIIGALVQISATDSILVGLATFGIFITSINIVAGFAVTRRMLNMFKK